MDPCGNSTHSPKRSERIQIRTPEVTITINEAVALNQGIQLYGEQLYLKGTGKIDLVNPFIHNKTIDIPASCDGSSTLTITDQVSINARILLSGKTYGTSQCKGTLILKDRSNVYWSVVYWTRWRWSWNGHLGRSIDISCNGH